MESSIAVEKDERLPGRPTLGRLFLVFRKEALLQGRDILAYTLQFQDAITTFEAQRAHWPG